MYHVARIFLPLLFLLLQACAGSPAAQPPPEKAAVSVPAPVQAQAAKNPVDTTASPKPAQAPSIVPAKVPASAPETVERPAAAQGDLSIADRKTFLQAVDALDAGRLVAAKAAFEQLSESHPQRASVWANLGTARMAGGEEDAALQAYEKAVTLDPTLAAIHERLGILYARRGDSDRAKAAYEAALAAEPGRASVHINLGILHERDLGQPGKALEHYRAYQRVSGAGDQQVQQWIDQLEQ